MDLGVCLQGFWVLALELVVLRADGVGELLTGSHFYQMLKFNFELPTAKPWLRCMCLTYTYISNAMEIC